MCIYWSEVWYSFHLKMRLWIFHLHGEFIFSIISHLVLSCLHLVVQSITSLPRRQQDSHKWPYRLGAPYLHSVSSCSLSIKNDYQGMKLEVSHSGKQLDILSFLHSFFSLVNRRREAIIRKVRNIYLPILKHCLGSFLQYEIIAVWDLSNWGWVRGIWRCREQWGLKLEFLSTQVRTRGNAIGQWP